MAFRLYESFGWSTFANSWYKATGGWGSITGGATPHTLTGSIDAGPFPGTFGKRFNEAYGPPDFFGNTGWGQYVDMGAFTGTGEQVWIVGMWVMPHAITSRQTFFIMETGSSATIQVNINAAGKIELTSPGDQPRMNTLASGPRGFITSNFALPMDEWTHVGFRVDCAPAIGGSSMIIYINGCPDAMRFGMNLSSGLPGRYAALVWQAPMGASQSITISQWRINDIHGDLNNSAVDPSEQGLVIFPTSDVVNGWTPNTGGSNFSHVNNPAGPNSGSYISLPSLASPDQLFGIDPLLTSDKNIALCLNAATLKATGSQTLQALMSQGASRFLLGSPFSSLALTSPSNVFGITTQAPVELNPFTGLPWDDADISADAFGFRGLTGTNERVEQFFLEKVWRPSKVSCGTSSYSY